jgi:hypothetical protein
MGRIFSLAGPIGGAAFIMSEQSTGQPPRIPPAAIAAIILAALCGLAFYLRTVLPYDQVFIKDWVWFRDTDCYYYLRHIENLVHNFPRLNAFDPYMLYPGGSIGLHRPFFAWLIAGIVRLVSLGPRPSAPSRRWPPTCRPCWGR